MGISSVNFGNITVQEGKVTLNPVIKGIDFKKIVDSFIDIKSVDITKQKNKLAESVAYVQALRDLQQKLQALQTAAQPLQNSLDSSVANVFKSMVISLQSTSSSVNADTVLSVTASTGVQPGNYSLTVSTLASTDVISASAGVLDPTIAQPAIAAGTIIINGTMISIPYQASLNQIVNVINAQKSQTNVIASVIKVSNTDYYLTLNATTTGVPIDIADDQGGGLLGALNMTSSGATVDSLSAHLTYNNLLISRPTNQINDLIPYLTLNVHTAAVGTPIIVTVKPDISAISTALQNFVSAYNTYQDFYLQQTVIDPVSGEVDSNSLLWNENLLRLTATYLSSMINKLAVGVPYDQPNSLRSLGMTLGEQGQLTLNQEMLNTYLTSDSTVIEQVCGFSSHSDNDQIVLLSVPSFLDSSFMDQTTHTSYPVTVTYAKDNSGVGSVILSMNGYNENATITNQCISPVARGVFKDFEFFCDESSVANGTSVCTVFTFSQGSMDNITNTIAAYLAPKGAFDTALSHLSQEQRFIYKKMNTAENTIAEERKRLTKIYAKVAGAYEKMETNIQTIRNFNDSFYARN